MNGYYAVFTREELMVLLSAVRASVLYGFWNPERPGRQAVVSAANSLVGKGILESGTEGFRVPPGPAANLLAPLRDPELAVLITPRLRELPQVCCVFGGGGGTAYEALAVQSGAVRLFSLPPSEWRTLLAERGLLRCPALPAASRWEREERVPDAAPQALLDSEPGGSAALEFYTPPQRRPFRRVILLDGPGDARAAVWTPGRSWRTNYLEEAVSLTKEEWEAEPQ